jgi:hypothetical protein
MATPAPEPVQLARPSSDAPVQASRPIRPELTFSVGAWLKLQYLCHLGDTEIGAFGISPPGRPFCIQDIVLIRQVCTAATVEFDDAAVADFFEDQVDQGRTPEQFARIWIHTHPGDSPEPSSTDEQTFARVFGRCGWAVMFILAKGGAVYCRLQVAAERGTSTSARIGLSQQITVRVAYADLAHEVPPLPVDQWSQEYLRTVEECSLWDWGTPKARLSSGGLGSVINRPPKSPAEIDAALEWFDSLDPDEQDLFLDQARSGWEDGEPAGWDAGVDDLTGKEVFHEE